jgi:hypothetical protein
MARGWESKSVEEQQTEALGERNSPHPRLSQGEQKRNRQHESLLLARKRIASQLDSAQSPRHRQMLEQSLAELDKQLSSFDAVTDPPAPK